MFRASRVFAATVLPLILGCHGEHPHVRDKSCCKDDRFDEKHTKSKVRVTNVDLSAARLTGLATRDESGAFHFVSFKNDVSVGSQVNLPVLEDLVINTEVWWRIDVQDGANSFQMLFGPPPCARVGSGAAASGFMSSDGTFQLNYGWVYLWGQHPRIRSRRIRAIGMGTEMHLIVPPNANSPHAVIYQSSPDGNDGVLVTPNGSATPTTLKSLPPALGWFCEIDRTNTVICNEEWTATRPACDQCEVECPATQGVQDLIAEASRE